MFTFTILQQIHNFKIRSAVELSNCFSQSNKLSYYQSPLGVDYCVLFVCFKLNNLILLSEQISEFCGNFQISNIQRSQ